MNTRQKTVKAKAHRFIVLVPHRDSRGLLENYRQRLFAAGFAGAYAFPSVAPLAQVSQSYKSDELKALAHELRRLSLLNEGKISTGQISCSQLAQGTAFLGPLLDLPPLDTILNNDKLLFIFSKVILCTSILSSPSLDRENEKLSLPDFPSLSFRAAMVSNLVIRPLDGGAAPYSFEWRLGPGCWLPAYKNH